MRWGGRAANASIQVVRTTAAHGCMPPLEKCSFCGDRGLAATNVPRGTLFTSAAHARFQLTPPKHCRVCESASVGNGWTLGKWGKKVGGGTWRRISAERHSHASPNRHHLLM